MTSERGQATRPATITYKTARGRTTVHGQLRALETCWLLTDDDLHRHAVMLDDVVTLEWDGPPDMCGCGKPIHYSRDFERALTQQLVDELGATTVVRTPKGSWLVPRHFIALHGLAAAKLPALAVEYGFEAIA